MGSSYSTEIKNDLDLEAPEVDAETVTEYNKEYEEMDASEMDSLFLYWWY
jgi:hypothetical protein